MGVFVFIYAVAATAVAGMGADEIANTSAKPQTIVVYEGLSHDEEVGDE